MRASSDTVDLARFLIGKVLVRDHRGDRTSGRIVETEAYPIGDAAGHAFIGMTAANYSLFLAKGHAYIYFIYGSSYMCNVAAERRGIGYSGYTDLAQNPATYDLLHEEIRRTNETLAPSQRVKRFAILHKELDPDDAEITRTRKLRRGFINERYATIIAALYDSRAASVAVKVTVTYEDGRTSDMERQVRIMNVEGA